MNIIYWSGTGNTEVMAKLIAQGIEEAGEKGKLINISNDKAESIKDEDIVILGCPSMGNEELEEGEFLPFYESIEKDLTNKKVVLFGSYGWGDGEWMRTWEEQLTQLGANVILEPLIINNEPEGNGQDQCIEYGKEIVKAIK